MITKVNDKAIDGPKALYEAVGAYKPEDKITITYQREGKELKTTALLFIAAAIIICPPIITQSQMLSVPGTVMKDC